MSKSELLVYLLESLNQRIVEIQASLSAAIESRNSDTKSSSGDKFETGREMIQAEINKLDLLFNKLQAQKQAISRINPIVKYSKAEFGSLIITNNGNFFIAIGIGKVQIKKDIYFAITLDSPIGLLLKDKVAGDTFVFNGKKYKIKDIL